MSDSVATALDSAGNEGNVREFERLSEHKSFTISWLI